ncbi:MAG TPA: TlyA family RNA methyltransferase [Bryobacteraceae bacterium]|jgi:23S rRNA (cytidine1920-2'-O)/16S rRNA (cytidine1409-2'-O)-methyltransferase|nr:TlyA family RNA methyltransferase [Bryobacteraceae bacterium]
MKGVAKDRIDMLLVDRGLAETRQKAQALILSGNVFVDGQRVDKPGQTYRTDSEIQVQERPRYVSRGGLKLEAALSNFQIDVAGKVCVDIGSSTGGFTDCLLQHGASKVFAIDVGTGQLDWKLRNDPRVVVKEQVNARHLTREHVPEPCQIAVCDVSFISVKLILPTVVPLLVPDSEMVILVKPQFEVGREDVGRGGIVRDPALHQHVCQDIEGFVRDLGFNTRLMESPILGAEGNREFLLHAFH